MKIKLLAIIFLSILNLESCCYNRECEKGALNIALVSFSFSDIDTLIFRRFLLNSNYLSPLDTMLIGDINIFNPYIRNDSIYLSTYNSSNFKFQIQIKITDFQNIINFNVY